MILSILIPSIPERANKLNILLDNLKTQVIEVNKTHPTLGEVEILIDDSKKFIEGGKSVGKKRYDLIKKAKGKYICFLDDDENVWHICPIKKDIAIKEKFDNINNAEDWKWIEKIISNIKTSYKINAILHQYNHSKNTSAVDEIEYINTKSI